MSRKNKFIAGVLAVCFVLAGARDLAATPGFSFGFKLGYTSGQLRAKQGEGDYKVDKYHLSGGALGLVGQIRLTDFLYFQPEVLYFQKGGKYRVGVPVESSWVTVTVNDRRFLDYLEVPLLLKTVLPLKTDFKPTFLIGASIGLNLSAKLDNEVKIVAPFSQAVLSSSDDVKKQAKAVEPSFIIGGGFDIVLPRGRIVIDQRFSFGLTTNHYEVVIPAARFAAAGFPLGRDVSYTLDMFNYVFAVSAGYIF